jgi:hypothetical protein
MSNQQNRSGEHFYWQMTTDRPKSFREGAGFDELVEALKDETVFEDEHVPDGFTASGNVTLYWSRGALSATTGTAPSA